ncbi:MAG: glycine--tRNA ligase subunit beta [Fimbriimonas sp.]
MPELLLELGTEELPASFVRKAYTDLRDGLEAVLKEAGVLQGTGVAMGSPRRLIVSFPDLLDRQADSQKEQRGPALGAAYDAEGNPTKALLGFCRSQGVDPADLRRDEQYVWVTKTIVGRPTAEILAEALPKAIRGLSFEKSMRWGGSRMRFARPIRWILAAFGGEAVTFEVEGVASGLSSRGHRFYAPDAFEARTLDALLEGLRARHVEPDADVRRTTIEKGSYAVAQGMPEISAALLDENTFLTEWPTPIQGTFREEFMSLPEPVLVTAMAKHEKMFPVREGDGRLTNRFVFVRNSGEDDTVREGCEWVLNARFNDAKFFFEEDAKLKLDDFLAKTETIVFQEKLGSVRQRAERLAALAAEVARQTGASDEEVALAEQSARYAKADLATGLVSELSSLQGVIGAEYGAREGFPPEVVLALRSQYDPGRLRAPSDAAARTAVRLVVADALDKLAGYLGLGLEPTGSSDPFALRRAATTLIEAAWNWPGAMPPYDGLLEFALERYAAQGVVLESAGAHAALGELFGTRYQALLPGVRYDILEAAVLPEMKWEATLPRGVRLRIRTMETLAADAAFVQTATRPLNIVDAAKKKGIDYAFDDPLRRVDLAKLDSPEGAALYEALRAQEDSLFRAAREEKADEVIAAVRSLAEPINRFFDGTMVMVDDADVRYARLTLLHACSLQLLVAGDFRKLEG